MIIIAGVSVFIALAGVLYLIPRLIMIYEAAGIKRKNFKGREITPSLGPIIPLVLVPAMAWISFWQEATGLFPGNPVILNMSRSILLIVIVTTGMCLVGFLDDILNENTRGFRGHLHSLRKGNLTSGMIKAIWGMMLALLLILNMEGFFPAPLTILPGMTITVPPALSFIIEKTAALLIILLWTNGINLLDRRPGRALKAFIFVGLILTFTGAAINMDSSSFSFGAGASAQNQSLENIWVVATGVQHGEIILLVPLLVMGLALMPSDLAGRAMLGDAGSNPLGAALGVYALLVLPFTGWLLFLLLGLTLNLAGEMVSLTKVIDSNPILSFLDRLGINK